MYDGRVYDQSAFEGSSSHSGRPKMPNNHYTNENYPNPAYGQMSQQQTAPERPYFGSDMQSDRRPLQPIDNPSLIGRVQQTAVRTYHGYSQAQMCRPLEAAYGRGLSHSEPMDVREGPGGGHQGGHPHQQQRGMGYLGGSQGYTREYSQEPQHAQHPQASAPYGAGAGPSSQHYGYAPEEARCGVYCDPLPPPALYSNFTPMYTSSPNTSPLSEQRGPEQHTPARVESLTAAEHQPAHSPQPSVFQQSPAVQWLRPTGLVSFERTQPAFPVPVRVPRPPKQHLNRTPEGNPGSGSAEAAAPAASSSARSSTPAPGPRDSKPSWPAPTLTPGPDPGASRPAGSGASFTLSSPTPSAGSSSGSERGGVRRQAAPAPERGIRVLTGTVDNILTWGKKLDEESRPEILFEIVGNLDSVMRGQWYSSRLVCLRSLQTSNTLTAVFWEIDRPLFPPPIGSVVACICRLAPRWPQSQQKQVSRRMPRMQMLSMRCLSPGQVVHYKRLAYVSSQSVQQGALTSAADPVQAGAGPSSRSRSPSPSMKQTLISSFARQER